MLSCPHQFHQSSLSCLSWSLLIHNWKYKLISSYYQVSMLLGFAGDSNSKESTCNAEIWVWSLGGEHPLEKRLASHSRILPWELHGQRSLAGYSLWGHKESDQTEWLMLSLVCYFLIICVFYFNFLIYFFFCSGFCHTLTRISHGFTCIPHPNPLPTSLSTRSLWVFPVHQVPALVSCSIYVF